MDGSIQLMSQSLRRLNKSKGFPVAVALTLAIGFAAFLTAYTLIDSILVHPLPYSEPDQLVAIHHFAYGLNGSTGDSSDAVFWSYKEHCHGFVDIGAYAENVVSVSDQGEPAQVRVALVSPSILVILGVKPLLGRLLTPEDDLPNARPVVLLSYDLWHSRYGNEKGIIGRTIMLNRAPKEVVGVLPPEFGFPEFDTQVWYPLGLDQSSVDPNSWYLNLIAKLKKGVSPKVISAELQALASSLGDFYPGIPILSHQGHLSVQVSPLSDALTTSVRMQLRTFLGVGLFVLLLVWANLLNLYLVRGDERRTEIVLKRALGASYVRLGMEFLIENFFISTPASVLALSATYYFTHRKFGMTVYEIPRLNELQIHATVILAAIGLASASAFLFSAVSLWRALQVDWGSIFRSGGLRTTGPGDTWKQFLIGLQVAVTVALLVGASWLVESFFNQQRIKLGFHKENVWSFAISLPYRQYSTYGEATRFLLTLERETKQLPGVSHVGAVSTPPLSSVPSSLVGQVTVEDSAHRRFQVAPYATLTVATAGYFATIGIPVLSGRNFENGDATSAFGPVIISYSLSRKLFSSHEPLGSAIRVSVDPPKVLHTVIGVVGDVPGARLTQGAGDILYFPVVFESGGKNSVPLAPSDMTVFVKSQLGAEMISGSIRKIVRALDPELPITKEQTLGKIVQKATADARLQALVMGCAAFVCLALGSIGIYAVTSAVVSGRAREFSIRAALGAQARDIIRSILSHTARTALLGAAVGSMVALIIAPIIQTAIFNVNTKDPFRYIYLTCIVVGIAILASYAPARRASRTDVYQTLKEE